MKKNIIRNFVKSTVYSIKEYFNENKAEIAKYNMDMLSVMVLLYLGSLILYYLTVCRVYVAPLHNLVVIIAIITQVIFSIAVYSYYRSEEYNRFAVNALCDIFGLLINTLSITIGVFVFPDEAALLYPLQLILMSQIYTLSPVNIFMLVTSCSVVFLSLSYNIKSPDIFALDLVATVVAYTITLVAHNTTLHYKLISFQANKDLKRLSSLDTTTGCYNKATFERLFTEYNGEEGKNENYVFAIMDVDDFKLVNDKYGHDFGDKVLCSVVGVIKNVLGETGKDYLIGRFGGDEFVLMLGDVTSRSLAIEYIERLSKEIKARLEAEYSTKLSCSIGATYEKRNYLSYQLLLQRADRALYRVKKTHKGESAFAER